MEKLLSVLIPVYNGEEFITRCVESILHQKNINLEQLEIVIANDGSSDRSLQLAKQLQEKHPSILRVFDKQNSGEGKTRQYLVEHSTGKYLSFIDADDYIDEDYYEKFLSKMNEADYDIVVSGYRRETDDAVIFEKKLIDNPNAKYSIFSFWGKVYHRRVFEKVPADTYWEVRIGLDLLHSLHTYEYFYSVGTVEDYAGYVYYVNEMSITNSAENSTLKNGEEQFQKMMDDGYAKINRIFKKSPSNPQKALFALKLYLSDYLNYSYRPFLKKERWFEHIAKKYPDFLGNIYHESTLKEIDYLEKENAQQVKETLHAVLTGQGETLYDENRTPVYL